MESTGYSTVELLTPNGPEFRRVSNAPPRLPTTDEMPVIDLSGIDGDLTARKAISSKIRAAAESTGFFYVRNHGIPEELIQAALAKTQQFFDQPLSEKEKVSGKLAGLSSGYLGVSGTQINKSETKGTLTIRCRATKTNGLPISRCI